MVRGAEAPPRPDGYRAPAVQEAEGVHLDSRDRTGSPSVDTAGPDDRREEAGQPASRRLRETHRATDTVRVYGTDANTGDLDTSVYVDVERIITVTFEDTVTGEQTKLILDWSTTA